MNTIEFDRRKDGPKGFPFAVTIGDKPVAWCKRRHEAELLAWSLCMQEELEKVLARDTINLLWDYFSRLRKGM